MGRKTFESLPKVLPNREHLVVTRNIHYKNDSKDVRMLYNLNEAIIKLFKVADEEYFVIGGGEIYKRFLPYCDKIYLTRIFEEKEADTYFDFQGLDDFIVESCTRCETNSSKHNILFFNYIRDADS
jgi:dihydrofolate reductase